MSKRNGERAKSSSNLHATVGTAVPFYALREARYGYLPNGMLHKFRQVVVPSVALPLSRESRKRKRKGPGVTFMAVACINYEIPCQKS
jgi:hypothetical protein